MKKSYLLMLLLCICLLLPACTAADPDNLFEMPLENPDDPAVSGTESTQTEPKEFITYTGTYPYGNLQIRHGNFLLLDNDVVFSHLANGKKWLYAYDLNREEARFYCNDATCSHRACASTAFAYHLEVFEGKLYGLMGAEYSANIFYLAVVNGNNPEAIVKANTSRYFHHEDKLYMVTADDSLVVLEDSQSEPQIVVEEFIPPLSIMPCGEYVYFQKYDLTFLRVHLTDENPKEELLLSNALCKIDGTHIYYTDFSNNLFYRCDLDGSNPEQLLKKKVGTFNFDDEYVYYTVPVKSSTHQNADLHNIYRFPKDDPTRIEKIVTLPDPVGLIYTVPGTGKLFIESYTMGDEEADYYVMNTDSSDIKKLELPKA